MIYKPAEPRRVRIVIADDHPIFRDGLRQLLEAESDLQVIGEAATGSQAVSVTRALSPDILLLDVTMPQESGLEVLRDLADSRGPTRIILLTAAIDRADIVNALQLGARGLVFKESATVLLLQAIRAVMDGQYWIGRETVTDLVFALRSLTRESREPEPSSKFGLTLRELQIVELVGTAASNKEIAESLSISDKTVKHHLTSIFDKLGVSSRVELALFAIKKLKIPI